MSIQFFKSKKSSNDSTVFEKIFNVIWYLVFTWLVQAGGIVWEYISDIIKLVKEKNWEKVGWLTGLLALALLCMFVITPYLAASLGGWLAAHFVLCGITVPNVIAQKMAAWLVGTVTNHARKKARTLILQ